MVPAEGSNPASGGMSNRDSLGFGDLIPHDVVEIFAQEKHHKKGRKKRSRSLGRALGWLKGKKRKDLGANGQNPGLGPALDLALDGHVAAHLSGNKGGGHRSGRQTQTQGNSHAALNLHDDKTPPPPLLQENVFIEASRPKYLEDLHSEALEGLKMMQQDDNNAGVEFQDNESTTSTMTAHTDGEGGGFTTDSTIPDASSVASMQSSVSTRSSRSGLTRQGSTFRPLNSGKQSEKGRTRKRHRKTVAGIPRHVQRELGLDRVGRTISSKLNEEEHFNGESDAEHQGASESGQNVIQPISEDQVEQIDADHMDDLDLLHRLGPDLMDGQRPRSVAVASMTTADNQQEMPSPVMSMSPQAAYMSKIIPNAVLPPSIEVVEISRGQSRNSLRTVSKSSLLLASPSPSRTSIRTTSSRGSKISSACRHNPYNLSDTSGWSHSESSETLVSDSSTISSGNISRKETSQDKDSDSIKVIVNGKLISKERGEKREGPFARSLSVLKPKRAPPPPSRSYSLHNKMKRRSRDLAEVVVISKETSPQSGSALGGGTDEPEASPVRPVDSPGYNGDTSSLDDSTGSVLFRMAKTPQASDSTKTGETVSSTQEKWEPPQENKVSKITSPSSGYSSQDCTSPQLQPNSSSPKHKRGILAKLQRLFPGASSPSPLIHLETNENTSSRDLKSQPAKIDCESISPSVRTLRELFDIPPPPKVHAPPAPPPEVWAHNKLTFELLLGPPAPDNVYAIIKKNPKDRRQQRSSASVSTEGSVKSLPGERKQNNAVEFMNGIAQKVQESALLNVNEVHKISNERLIESVNTKENSNVKQNDEKVRVSDILSGMLVKAVAKREERLAIRGGVVKNAPTQASEETPKVGIIHAISLTRTSPSPPPAHFPPEPPGKQPVNNAASPDPSWPPPPPPITQVVGVPDELDFPLPPPPLMSEDGIPTSPATVAITAPTIIVTAEPEPQGSVASHGLAPPPPLNIPPPPAYAAPPPPIIAAIPVRMKEVVTSPPKEVPQTVPPPPPLEVVPVVLATHPVPPPLVNVKEESQPPVVPPETVATVRSEAVIPEELEKETLASKLYPPLSIPPPPPRESLKPDSEVISSESPSKMISCNGTLTPPQSIPPPPPLELLPSTEITDIPVAPPRNSDPLPSLDQPQSSPPVSIPAPPPLPVGGLDNHLRQTSPASSEKKNPEPPSDNIQEESIPVVTPSLLQMVKLRPVNSSPEPPAAQEQAQGEDGLKIQQPGNPTPLPQPNEAPQKPIRRSLIISSPTSTSPPAIVTSPPALPQPQSVVVPPAPSPPTLKSPAMPTSPQPSMNLQEAIRLRTAARSKDSSAFRLSLPSPTSPKSLSPSPTSTASFIFSKNKRAGIDAKTLLQRSQDISTKVIKEAESTKNVKMPPPVAKKPKTKAIDAENGDGVEPTAGQPAQTESIKASDAAEKSNGARVADGGHT
ncbi:NHS-like protein 3 isoform X2 [Festucalex cinctus]